jgi:hypothetical protein
MSDHQGAAETSVQDQYAKSFWDFAREQELEHSPDLAILLGVKSDLLEEARRQQSLPDFNEQRRQRVELVLSLESALTRLFPDKPEKRRRWLHEPRDVFQGQSVLQMIVGEPEHSLERLQEAADILQEAAAAQPPSSASTY